MNPSLSNQISQSQQMILSQRMIENLKILQMSNLDLTQYIEEVLVDNPLLEAEVPDEESPDIEQQEQLFQAMIIEKENDVDTGDSYDYDSTEKDFINYTSVPISLHAFLLAQLGELNIDSKYSKMAAYIIENIEEDGYLHVNIQRLASSINANKEEFKTALRIVQSLDPEGVGARNLKECLLIQLKRRKFISDDIKNVILKYMDLLAERRYHEIAKQLGITQERVKKIHDVLKELNPKPGMKYSNSSDMGYIVPELMVRKIGAEYMVSFLEEKIPRLNINTYYKDILKRKGNASAERKYVKEKLSKAIEVMNAIEQRKKTILNVSECIVKFQRDFFEKGYTFLKPLTMKEVAENIGIHESTVSRAVSGKYMQTPRGIFELKFFFSSNIQNKDHDISGKGVKDIIKKIIMDEDKEHPLSDEEIRKILGTKEIRIARRTIAKYREELSILAAIKRKI